MSSYEVYIQMNFEYAKILFFKFEDSGTADQLKIGTQLETHKDFPEFCRLTK